MVILIYIAGAVSWYCNWSIGYIIAWIILPITKLKFTYYSNRLPRAIYSLIGDSTRLYLKGPFSSDNETEKF